MILLAIALAAEAGPDTFEGANTSLAAGDLAGAIEGYRALLEAGYTDGDVYYNLGNVLFRADRPAAAILAWRHAAARLPRDPDVQANLDFARRKLRDSLVAPDPTPSFAPWQVALTPSEAVWLGAGLAGAGLLTIGFRRRFPLPVAGPGVALSVVGSLLWAGGIADAQLSPVAVVLAESVTATSDLGGGVDLFTLHSGAEVQTVEEAAGRVQILLPDGRRGWVAAESVGVVDPERRFPAG